MHWIFLRNALFYQTFEYGVLVHYYSCSGSFFLYITYRVYN